MIVALLGCLHLCGGHWGVMQAVAWANMLVDYSAQDGLVEGAKKTFDGEHPCCMCKAIQAGKEQESHGKKLPVPSQGPALKECLFTPAFRLSPPAPRDCAALSIPDLDLRGPLLGHRPPVPPPRCA